MHHQSTIGWSALPSRLASLHWNEAQHDGCQQMKIDKPSWWRTTSVLQQLFFHSMGYVAWQEQHENETQTAAKQCEMQLWTMRSTSVMTLEWQTMTSVI